MIKTLAVMALERTIQTYLSLAPDTLDALSKLEGKAMHIDISDWHQSLYLLPCKEGLRLQTTYTNTPDVSLSASLTTFIKIAVTGENIVSLPKEANMKGDAALAQKIFGALTGASIDWENILSNFVGDQIAHQIFQTAISCKQTKREISDSLKESLTEYLQEEKRLLPPRQEVEDFYDDIDILKSDVDRLAVKLKLLST